MLLHNKLPLGVNKDSLNLTFVTIAQISNNLKTKYGNACQPMSKYLPLPLNRRKDDAHPTQSSWPSAMMQTKSLSAFPELWEKIYSNSNNFSS